MLIKSSRAPVGCHEERSKASKAKDCKMPKPTAEAFQKWRRKHEPI